MLKGIDPILTAEILQILMMMGHGDEIVVCDVNHPSTSIAKHTTHGKLVDLAGCDIPRATRAILSLMPLDTFVAEPVMRMLVVDDPQGEVPIFARMQAAVEEGAGRQVKIGAYERFSFYEAARRSFAIVRTSDPGPYGCFILKKGVI
jgi:L-fucose mutarotase